MIKGTTNLIVNGSFEEGTAASYGQYATLPGWTGNGDKIEVATAATYGVTGATGHRVMELDANTTCTVTGVYQDVATAAGKQYELSLDVAARNCTPNSTNTVRGVVARRQDRHHRAQLHRAQDLHLPGHRLRRQRPARVPRAEGR